MGLLSWIMDELAGFHEVERITAEVRQEEHIDEGWSIRGKLVYHVENSKNGREWTANPNHAPQCGHRGVNNPLTQMTPPFDYQHYTARAGHNRAAEIAEMWNDNPNPQDTEEGYWEGATHHYTVHSDDPDYNPFG